MGKTRREVDLLISKERFKEKFQDLAEIMGWKISENRARLIYETVMNYERIDFEQAIDSMRRHEHFNFYMLETYIRQFQTERLEKQVEENKKAEERAFMAWWRSHRGTRQECINYLDCFSCKREYCDIIAVAAIAGLKDIISGKKTKQQVDAELSRFKGMGWEEQIPEAQAF